MWEHAFALAGLFAVAFGAATILPLQSEIVFIALQLRGDIPIEWIVLVASIGNTLGSGVNYALGRVLERFHGSKWFPVSDAQLERAQTWYAKWGVWTLLFSWAPLGDALTVIAGVMRTNIWLFFALVTLAKTLRYIAVAYLTAITLA